MCMFSEEFYEAYQDVPSILVGALVVSLRTILYLHFLTALQLARLCEAGSFGLVLQSLSTVEASNLYGDS